MTRAILALVITCGTAALLRAEQWPNWRGPILEWRQPRDQPARTLVEDRERHVAARVAGLVGIDGDHLGRSDLSERRGGREPVAVVGGPRPRACRSGKSPWEPAITREMKHNMSSPSPVTDGRNVWVMTGTGILKAFDFSGTELWTRDIQKDYGRFGFNYGYASSPLLHEDSLYVQVLHGMTDRRSVVRPAASTRRPARRSGAS